LRAAQRCAAGAALANAPFTTSFLPASLDTLLAVHSWSDAPIERTLKPDTQASPVAQVGSHALPVENTSPFGPRQARSHSSSVQSRAPRSAHIFCASACVTPVSAGTPGFPG
jgi:hypothetical protein